MQPRADAAMFTTRPTLQGMFGMASSTHWIATQTAMRSLERGGNAFDPATSATHRALHRLGDGVVSALQARGHRVQLSGAWSLGRMCAVARDPATGVLSAGANPRGMQGYACGRWTRT